MAAVKGAGSVTVTYNSNNITAYVNSASIAASIAELDTTDLASTAMEYIPGLADFTVSLEAPNWDATLDGYIMPDLLTPAQRTLSIVYSDGTNTVTYAWTTASFLTAGTLSAEATGLVSLTGISIRGNGAPSRTPGSV
jgi:hypothetical protein